MVETGSAESEIIFSKKILHSSSAPAILKPMQPQSSINLRKRDNATMLSGTAAETKNAPSSLGFPGIEKCKHYTFRIMVSGGDSSGPNPIH